MKCLHEIEWISSTFLECLTVKISFSQAMCLRRNVLSCPACHQVEGTSIVTLSMARLVVSHPGCSQSFVSSRSGTRKVSYSHSLADRGRLIFSISFSSIKEGMFRRRLHSLPWTARKSNPSILREINPEYSLERLLLKLKLQCFGYLMRRTDSLEKTLMLGKT